MIRQLLPAAEKEAIELNRELIAGGFDSVGTMIGVLVSEDENRKIVITKAFSGQLHGSYISEGWAPPVFDVDRFNEITAHYDPLIKRADNAEERSDLSRKALSKIYELYMIPTINGDEIPMTSLFDRMPPTGSGDCAAPKLLAESFRLHRQPIRMSEFRYTGNEDIEFSHPCEDRCHPILRAMMNLDILYADDHIAVIDKYPGLPTIPGRTEELKDCVTQRIRRIFPHAIEQNSVHRLDMDTSGLLVVAFDRESHRNLSIQFQNGEVKKRYIALVDGILKQNEGVIDLPIRLDVDNRPHQIVDHVQGKKAVTEFRKMKVIKYNGRFVTEVEYTPLTGRTHQLRVHSLYGLGMPIVGDRLYGTKEDRLMLFATYLRFRHPATGEIMEFSLAD